MKLAKFTPDQEGVIYLNNVTAAVWTGLQDQTPTMICAVAEGSEIGRNLVYYVKKLGDSVTSLELKQQFLIALVANNVEYLIFSDKPQMLKIVEASDLPPTNPGPGIPGWNN